MLGKGKRALTFFTGRGARTMAKASRIMSHPRLSVMNFLNCVSSKNPGAISFGSGRPADDFCEIEKCERWRQLFLDSLPEEVSRQILLGQYGPTKGIIGDHIAKMLKNDEGIDVAADDIIVTLGGQESMILPLFGLFNRGEDVLIVTDPCFIGITGAAEMFGVELEPVSISSSEGYCLEKFEEAILKVKRRGKNPKASYVIPDFDNPIGGCMPLSIRQGLLALAEKHNMLIFEDNPYGIFRYEGEKIPMIKSLDTSKVVMYMGSFAKTLFPGLRGGFLVADQQVETAAGVFPATDILAKVKSFLTVNTSPLIQAYIGGALIEHNFSLEKANASKIAEYKTRRDCMLRCLEEQFPKEEWGDKVSWNHPEGGFFLTVSLPFDFDDLLLEKCVKEYSVIVVPLNYFSIKMDRGNEVRLAFSNNSVERIEEGIAYFGNFVRDQYALLYSQKETERATV